MLRDIEEKKVNMVITKDLSRLGRDYIAAGQYTEIYFPSKKVRYIAINDGYDSDSACTDIAPFKNVINEMYARDISKKIRSAFVTHMQEGDFIGAFAPYGYRRDPDDKHHLVVDEEAARVVREIFSKAAEGVWPAQIARDLNDRRILTPMEYRCRRHPAKTSDVFSKRKEWTSSTIVKMLKNVVYLGITAQGKTTKVSFKSNIAISNPKEDWYVVENTHEALIEKSVFELAGRRSRQRTCMKRGTFHNVFSGIAKCADCGRNMSTVGARKKGSRANLTCGGYKLHGSGECSNHFIDYDILYGIVLASIREVVRLSSQDEQDIIKKVKDRTGGQEHDRKIQRERVNLRKREQELDVLIEKVYEDYAKGIIGAERMRKLLDKYEKESLEIRERQNEIEEEGCRQKPEAAESEWKALLHKIMEPAELTQELLYRLIDHIEIGQGAYQKTGRGKVKQQSIKIWYRFEGTAAAKDVFM